MAISASPFHMKRPLAASYVYFFNLKPTLESWCTYLSNGIAYTWYYLTSHIIAQKPHLTVQVLREASSHSLIAHFTVVHTNTVRNTTALEWQFLTSSNSSSFICLRQVCHNILMICYHFVQFFIRNAFISSV